MAGFNPHPVRRPDETPNTDVTAPPDKSFNPHPVRRPDETSRGGYDRARDRVSIHIRSEDRMRQLSICCYRCPFDTVSIHIRSEDRMRRAIPRTSWCVSGFNPHPVRRPDETLANHRLEVRESVSIHIRSEDRMRRPAALWSVPLSSVFQSTSGPKTG